MTKRSSQGKHSSHQVFDIAWATPLVMSLRIFQMLASGPNPSRKDRKEFDRMWSEKLSAYNESWTAMYTECLRLQQDALPVVAEFWFNPWAIFSQTKNSQKLHQPDHLGERLISKGLAPIHKRVTANAKRLSRGA
jgi:hypothetical protein